MNLAFEFGQLPQFSAPITKALQFSFGSHEPAQALSRSLLNGSFDPADVLALSTVALAAAGLLRWLHRRESGHEH